MNNLNLSPEQQNLLLQTASKKLGVDPNTLKTQLQQGKFDGALGSMSPAQKKQLGALLQNPKALEKVLQNPQLQQVIKKVMEGR